jgi:hypothetical protein
MCVSVADWFKLCVSTIIGFVARGFAQMQLGAEHTVGIKPWVVNLNV